MSDRKYDVPGSKVYMFFSALVSGSKRFIFCLELKLWIFRVLFGRFS